MKDFNTEKEKLVKELELEIKNYPKSRTLSSIRDILASYKEAKDIHGAISYIIRDSFELDLPIAEKLIDFELYFSDYTNFIKSEELRKIAKYLQKLNKPITYYGKPWSDISANWIYFDTILDMEKIKYKFDLNENIIIHENLDAKSGLERGFIDKRTSEGLMGKVSESKMDKNNNILRKCK